MERQRTKGVRAWMSDRLWGTPGWLLMALGCAAVLGFAAEGAVRSLRAQPAQPLLVGTQFAMGFAVVRWKLRDSFLAVQAILAAGGCGLIALALGRLGLEADAILRGIGPESGPLGAPMLLPSLTFAVTIAAGTNLISRWRRELAEGPTHAAVERALDQTWAPIATGLVLLATLVGAFVFSDQGATQRIATLGAVSVLVAPPWGVVLLAVGLRLQAPRYVKSLRAERAELERNRPKTELAPAPDHTQPIAKPQNQPAPADPQVAQPVGVRKNLRIDPAALPSLSPTMPPSMPPTTTRDTSTAAADLAMTPLGPSHAALQARLRGLRRRSTES